MERKRRFDNRTQTFADGTAFTVGTHSDGTTQAIKLRLPDAGWKIAQVFGPTSEDSEKPTIVVLERG